MLTDKKICFIGAGAMAEAILAGLTKNQIAKAEDVAVTNRSNSIRLRKLGEYYGVQADAAQKFQYVKDADILILAVKPKDMWSTMQEIRSYTNDGQLLLSVAAGITTEQISRLVEHQAPVIRSMPNTSASIGQSATCICGGDTAGEAHFQIACTIFESIGSVFKIKEKYMDAVTAVSGSGPAFIYYFVEAMLEGAGDLGLEETLAKRLIQQTMLGAANMLLHSGQEPSVLRQQISSPGGTTLAGLDVLDDNRFKESIRLCLQAAAARATELGTQLSEQVPIKP
jgi:pyrroline-5-carboxylate reductase